MRMHIDNKLVIITEPKTIRFDVPKDVGNNLKHEIDSIIKHSKFLAEHTMPNISMYATFMNTENSKTSD